MIAGGLAFVWTAYAVTAGALAVLAAVAAQRLAYWARRARELEREP